MQTRMHSSRMRTVRCSSRLGGGCLPEGGVCLGGVWTAGVYTSPIPPVDRMTDACENISFPQILLQTEMM